MRRLATLALLLLLLTSSSVAQTTLPGGGKLTIGEGVSQVVYERDGETLAIYRGEAERLLLTDGRRDLVADTLLRSEAGDPLPKIIAPAKATYWLEKPHEFWQTFIKARFHDYSQQTTKVPAAPLDVERWVNDGDSVTLGDLNFKAVETPGYTRSGLTYVLEADGKRIAFTGDLIYGDGKIRDLYSFQDAIPEANIRGYHGYGSRLAQLVASIDKLQSFGLDMIVPARGEPIDSPRQSLATLKLRVQSLYANYLSTNALHWYFKEDRMRACGARVLGDSAKVELMPYCEHKQTPDWIYENGTSRMLISESGHGFLLDCGNDRVIKDIQKLQKDKVIKEVEGLFVTHYHDDHTDSVQKAAETFQCSVLAMEEYAGVLSRPDAYHLPAMTANPIEAAMLKNGHKKKWREFDLTFFFFPGQTYYHGAMLARKPGADPILFVGDAFAPSGIDDYCVLNRNLLGEDQGYLKCLKQVESLPDAWLINEHIRHIFRFNKQELEYLQSRYRERIAIQSELFTMDAPNYGVDEQWVFFRPYAVKMKAGRTKLLRFQVWNHSPIERTFEITPRGHNGAKIASRGMRLTLSPNKIGDAAVAIRAPRAKPEHGVALITLDVRIRDQQRTQLLSQWVEAMVIVE